MTLFRHIIFTFLFSVQIYIFTRITIHTSETTETKQTYDSRFQL